MVRAALRAAVAAVGIAGLALAMIFWLRPLQPAHALGVSADGALGLATLRADLGGFFGAVGALSLAAALRANPRLLTAPVLMIALALIARLATLLTTPAGLLTTPAGGALLQPMTIEMVLLVILATARLALKAHDQ